jgi:hypothetical protein
MEKDRYKNLFADVVKELSASSVKAWQRTEREFKLLRDPKQRITLPKLKFLEDEQT